MELEKELKIHELTITGIYPENKRYTIKFGQDYGISLQGYHESTIILRERDLEVLGIKLSIDLVGKILVVKLESREIKAIEDVIGQGNADYLDIEAFLKTESRTFTQYHKYDNVYYFGIFTKNTSDRNEISLPCYDLILRITQQEYEGLREIGTGNMMRTNLRLKE